MRSKSNEIFIKSIYEKYGCKLLEEYKGYHIKVKFLCKCGKIDSKTFHCFKLSPICRECILKKYSKEKLLKYEHVAKFYEKNKCILLDNTYINADHLMNFVCKCGRKDKRKFSHFKKYPMCTVCGKNENIKKRSGRKHYKWNSNRKKIKENIKFRTICKNLINRTLRNLETNKNTNTYKLLGYGPKELIIHIKNDPNWLKIKDKKWHIDHIFPVKAFLDYGITNIKIINALENLRPILAEENYSKHDKYDKKVFENWLINKNLLK